ncbi:hypothetical protein O6072_11455 [Mycolicibacterium neoaurum]|uniref:WXG100-like domain-containing protein n=1 Tax=Mycolicibacterium neoaurum TaxID=1795 RepID=UPI00248B478E|nr:hypothetical protein [Mycolicibacterium neoaurum]WBP96732.1 hypothetical protein O7W24_11460 [Mycolicibacterium neoaurum]WBS10418.1 hypothetical protein O6072_11455 [Mycolicibacterium neoaurum]
MTTRDVDPETFYAVGKRLYELAGDMYDAFNVNVRILAETGEMAGSDDAGTAWAESYDSRVGEVLGAVNDLTVAMENYGGVVIQAGHNHAMAEHNATPGAGAPPVKPPEPTSVAGILSVPPSAGGPGEGLLDNLMGLVDQIGVPVPDGNTDKLDKAAQAWDRLATVYQTTTVVEALEVNAQRFADTKTPEVEFIARDLRELKDATSAILDGCAELSKSCADYKTALGELRNNLEGILEDLAEELATTVLIGIAASVVSAGFGAVAATAKAANSITKFARTIGLAIASWKLSKNFNKGVQKVADIAKVRKQLERIKNLGRKGKKDEPNVPPPVSPPGVQPGWPARPADRGPGTVYQKPSSPGDSNSVRIMEPGADPRYPNGYVKFTNEHNQPINLDGKPGPRAETHIPRNPDGSYPIPKGWPR